jgi:hypothetical protein
MATRYNICPVKTNGVPCGKPKTGKAKSCKACFHKSARQHRPNAYDPTGTLVRRPNAYASVSDGVPKADVERKRAENLALHAPRASPAAAQCPDSPTGAHHWLLDMGTCWGCCNWCEQARLFNSSAKAGVKETPWQH